MRTIPTLVSNYDSSSGGFTEGQLRDNPGDDSGSGVVAGWGNDVWYALTALVTKYRTGGKGAAAESTTNSDFLDAIEEMSGQKVSGVSNWASGTTYSTIGEKVMRYGVQFTCISTTANLNKDPLLYPLLWSPVPKFEELFRAHATGRVMMGDCSPMHQYSHASYLASFSLGTHKVGGASGQVFNALGIHLDGAAYASGSAGYTALASWAHAAIFSTLATSYTMTDARARVLRAISATGGLSPTIGALIEDQLQGHKHTLTVGNNTGGGAGPAGWLQFAASFGDIAKSTDVTLTTDGTNGTPRTGTETRVKSLTVGVPYVVIMVPV
jgi:hypothetical protein